MPPVKAAKAAGFYPGGLTALSDYARQVAISRLSWFWNKFDLKYNGHLPAAFSADKNCGKRCGAPASAQLTPSGLYIFFSAAIFSRRISIICY